MATQDYFSHIDWHLHGFFMQIMFLFKSQISKTISNVLCKERQEVECGARESEGWSVEQGRVRGGVWSKGE